MSADNLGPLHHATRTFRPPQVSRTLRRILGVVLVLPCLVPPVVITFAVLQAAVIDIDVSRERVHLLAGPGFLASEREVATADIRSVQPQHLGQGGRSRGTCMAGHCSGWWFYQDIGSVWQATDCRSDVLLVQTAQGPLVLSASDMEGLREALERHLPWHDRAEVNAPGWLRVLLGIVALVALLGAAWVVLACFGGAERLAYEVGPQGLTIHTLGRPRMIALQGAVVRRVTGRIGMRIAGVGLPGYFTGLYWVDGASARLWATRAQDGVLIESGGRFLVTPEHPEAFIEALVAMGARTPP